MQLDTEQQIALNAMLAGENVFLSGRAGTGKSTVINEFLRHVPPNLVCVAPTGMAARNLLHAETIHRCFNLPIGVAYPLRKTNITLSTAELLKNIRTVLIDEVAMVRSDVFIAMDALLQRYAASGKQKLPFGGRQVIVVGDFYQLSPVVDRVELESFIEERFGGIYAFNTASWQRAAFRNINLTQIHRQTDINYIDFLNAVRCCSEELPTWLPIINERVRPDFQLDIESDTICLCCRNQDANIINGNALMQLSDPGIMRTGIVTGYFPAEELPVAMQMKIKRGARVMIQGNRQSFQNSDTYQYVNGDIGTVVDYDRDGGTVTVKLNRGGQVKVTPTTWSYYKYTTWRDADGILQIKQEDIGSFTQIPIGSAYAASIHKAQGQTLNNVHLILGRQCFSPGQFYTAATRVRSFQDITLDRPLRINDVQVDAMVQDFMSKI